MPYSVRRVRRICDVKGCRNTDCYSISKSRETGNSIIMCRECLAGGLDAIEEVQKNSPAPKETEKREPPELFFLGAISKSKTEEKAAASGEEPAEAGSTKEKSTAEKSKASGKSTKNAK